MAFKIPKLKVINNRFLTVKPKVIEPIAIQKRITKTKQHILLVNGLKFLSFKITLKKKI